MNSEYQTPPPHTHTPSRPSYMHHLFIVLTDSSSCQDGRYLLIDSAFGSWNSGSGLLNVITSVRSWLEMDALYMRSDLCRILRTLCIALLSNSWSISGSCQKKWNKQITWLENLKWKHWFILLCIYKHFTIAIYICIKETNSFKEHRYKQSVKL